MSLLRDSNTYVTKCKNCSSFKKSLEGKTWFKLVYQLLKNKNDKPTFEKLLNYSKQLENRGSFWASVKIEGVFTVIKCCDCKAKIV